jgi:copper chaperone
MEGQAMSEKHSFVVNDMTCGHCVGTLTKALAEALPGSAVNIDLASHRVEFTGNKAKGEEAIREAGYTPEPA